MDNVDTEVAKDWLFEEFFRYRAPRERCSLRDILASSFPDGLPGECIRVIIRNVLKGLSGFQSSYPEAKCKPEITADRVVPYFVTQENETSQEGELNISRHRLQILYDREHLHKEDDVYWMPKIGVWGTGILALELAFGSLPEPVRSNHQELVKMSDNVQRILSVKLEDRNVEHGSYQRVPNNEHDLHEDSIRTYKALPKNLLELVLKDAYMVGWQKKRDKKIRGRGNFWSRSTMVGGAKKCWKDCFKFCRLIPGAHHKKIFSKEFLQLVMICLDRKNPKEPDQILALEYLKWDQVKSNLWLLHTLHQEPMFYELSVNSYDRQVSTMTYKEENILKIMQLPNGFILQMVLKAAIELDLFELMARHSGPDGRLSAIDIASRLQTTNPDAPAMLDRMLRYLASFSFVKCTCVPDEDGKSPRMM